MDQGPHVHERSQSLKPVNDQPSYCSDINSVTVTDQTFNESDLNSVSVTG
jgi:hypothetical protein